MSKRTLFGFCILILFSVGISGCGPPPTPTPTTIPPCDPASFIPPDLISPDWREVVDGSSVWLEWSYADSCTPTDYEIILSKDRDFSVLELTETVSGSITSWSPPVLDVAEEYFWRVRAVDGAIQGPYSEELRSFFTLPICDPDDLVAPTLIYPSFGGIFVRGYDSLEWEWPLTTCIPESYIVELAYQDDFTDRTLFGATGTPGTRWGPGTPLLEASMYAWRVSAGVGEDQGPFSDTSRFYTDPVCSPVSLSEPELSLPADSDTLTSSTPEFTWDYPHLCSPEGFHFQISSSPDFSSPAIDVNQPTLYSTRFVVDPVLEDCQTYFWRVAVISEGTESPFSEVRVFFTDHDGSCACDPGDIPVPAPIAPENFAVVPDLDPILEWYNPGDCYPDGYQIALGTDFLLDDSSVVGGTTTHTLTSWRAGPLEPVTHYKWQVAGVVGDTVGEYSSRTHFFTGPECLSLTGITAPVRLKPEDEAILDSLTVVFEIRPGDPTCLPDGYFVNLQTDPTFSGLNLMGDQSVPATTFSYETLTDCTTYYWKVAAIQDGGYGPESDVGSFFTNQSGTCPLPGTAKMNAFCREGTFPEHWPIAKHLFLEGDPVQVIAQNPFSTYLLVYVPDQRGVEPVIPHITCWTLFDAVEPLDGFSFRNLPVEFPPPTPIPSPTPKIACHQNLGPNACVAAGGIYWQQNQVCQCP